MMIDNRAAVTLVTREWAQSLKLSIKLSKDLEMLAGAAGTDFLVVGSCDMVLRFSGKLELELRDLAVAAGGTYQALLVTDVLVEHQRHLEAATGVMPSVCRPGMLLFDLPLADYVAKITIIIPPSSYVNANYPLPPEPSATALVTGMLTPPTTFEEQQVKLSTEGLATVRAVCIARDAQRASLSIPDEDLRNMMNWARQSFRAAAIPKATSRLQWSGVT